MSVRAKFKVESIERRKHWDRTKGEVHTVRLSPVVGGSTENEQFYAATPGGSMELGTVSDDAAKNFELGAEYYIDFTKA